MGLDVNQPGAQHWAGKARVISKIGMQELAELAGVSVSTVSRALAGKTIINAKTRERVVELARAHGFKPNQAAQNLRLRRAQAIGVVIPMGHEIDQHPSDPFFMTMLGHLADALTERNFDLLLSRVIPSGTTGWMICWAPGESMAPSSSASRTRSRCSMPPPRITAGWWCGARRFQDKSTCRWDRTTFWAG